MHTAELELTEDTLTSRDDDRYEILETLGVGGTSLVSRARDRSTGEIVALKSLHPTCAAHPTVSARFEREAVLASRIRHANVGVVHGIVVQGGTRFLSMEYVEGHTLAALLASRHRLPRGVALNVMRQLCDGVQAAHDEGVIHRDLKPENVLIARRDGRVVLLDFGIARLLGDDSLTQAGMAIGSLHYMSPEQLCGAQVTTSADVYALGVILHELVTGECPFRAPGLTLVQHASLRASVPDPRAHAPELEDWLVHAIRRALAVDPADRFASARELWSVLDANRTDDEREERAIRLHVDGRAVLIGKATTALVALPPGESRDLVVDRLQRLGCSVSVTENGAEALERSFQERSRLLVLGDGLAGLDPLTACQVMRRFARWDATKALVLVDARDEARRSQAREAGADEVVTLPLQVHAFARQVRRLLE